MNKLLILPLLIILSCAGKKENGESTTDIMKTEYKFLIGAYTVEESDGIALARFDPNDNSLEILAVNNSSRNPSYVISNKSRTFVYTVEETGGEQGGQVSSYHLDTDNNSLEKISSTSSMGNGPCHLTLDPTENYLFVGNYSAGTLAVIPVHEDGSLSEALQTIVHSGSSVNENRQKQPHVHSTVYHPKENKLFVGDLGTDEINIYTFDPQSDEPLSPAKGNGFKVEGGAGPRHLVFNEEGNVLYLVHEMTAEVGVYAYENEVLEHIETYSLLREDFSGSVGAAEVRITKDGKYLYVSNRGEANEIVGFEIDKNNGRLRQIQIISTGGEAPRNFALTPDEKYVLVGNQNSNNINVFSRDSDGKLKNENIQVTVNRPSYIHFLP